MADNVAAFGGSAGTSFTFATDDIGGIHYPIHKVAFGALDTGTLVTASVGLPVNVLNTTLAVTQSGTWSITGTVTVDTELPAAAALADNMANPTTPLVGACLAVWDGGFWDRLPGNSTDGALVNLGTNNDVTVTSGNITVSGTATVSGTVAATQSGTWTLGANSGVDIGDITINNASGASAVNIQDGGNTITVDGTVAVSGTVTIAGAVTNAGTFATQVDGAALTALQLIDNPVLVDDAAFTPATSSVMMAGFQADEASTDSVDEGDAGAARMTLDRKQIVTLQPHTAGGLTPYKLVSAATTNATVVKASAGQLYEIFVSSVNAAVRYLKLYDKATSPTIGTDTPIWTLAIPGNTAGAGFAKTIPNGLTFTAGISFGLTTEATDAGTTAVAANEIVVNLGYK